MPDVDYRVCLSGAGWQGWVFDGQTSGSTNPGDDEFVIGIEVKPDGNVAALTLYYEAWLQNFGWQGWVQNGGTAGALDPKKAVACFRADLSRNDRLLTVVYRVFSEGVGWQGWKSQNQTAGAKSRRIKAIRMIVA